MSTLHWHPLATLTDFDGTSTGADKAARVPPNQSNDPATPLTAIPGFLNALAIGLSPIIGPKTDAPDQPDSFFTLTGGTTGAPKIIRRSTGSWASSIQILRQKLALGPKSHVATLGNLTYSLSLYSAIEAIHSGAHFHFTRGSDLAKRGITHLYATPTQLRLLRTPAQSLRHIITGGGPFDSPTAAHVNRLFPKAQIWRFYGAAETSFITLADQTAPEGSVGPAFPGVDIAIRDDAGNTVQAGTTGLVWLRSPMLFDSYARGSSSSTKWQDGWLSVGELGHLDAAGNLYLSGRMDRVLTIADKSVSLDQLEAALIDKGAAAAAIVALPDPLRGHVLHGFIEGHVPKPVALKTLTELPALPRLTSGKADYAALRKRLR